MTMPHLENCPHSSDGWCLACVKDMHDKAQTHLKVVNDLVKAKDEYLNGYRNGLPPRDEVLARRLTLLTHLAEELNAKATW